MILSNESISERPGGRSAHAMTISNLRRLASVSMESRPGRPFRPLNGMQSVAIARPAPILLSNKGPAAGDQRGLKLRNASQP
jgi:hypothetical protein